MRATGNSMRASTRSSPRPCSRKSRAPPRSCSCRIITSRCFRDSSSSAVQTRSSATSGIFPGRIGRRSASARGRKRFSTACSAAICLASTCSCIATIFSKRSIASSSRASTTSTFRSRARRTKPRSVRFRSASTWKASRRTASAAATYRHSARRSACATSGRWRSASIAWTTRRAFPSACAPSIGFSSATRSGASGSCFCRWVRRAGRRSPSTRISTTKSTHS